MTDTAHAYLPHTVTGNGGRYGWHLVLDLHDCNPLRIESEPTLRTWIEWLVPAIGMTAYGPPRIERFGHDDPITAGYTLVQLIETSSITAHFSPYLRTAHIDVFSCRPFEPERVITFTESRLGGRGGHMTFLTRG